MRRWVAERRCLWYGVLGAQQVRVVLVRETGRNHGRGGYGLALVTTDLDSSAADIVVRCAARWSIEVAIFDAKQTAGVGQARNRTPKAVERTVPFGLLCLSLGIVWYALAGHIAERWRWATWYASKANPSVADMFAALRRLLIAVEFRPQPHTNKSLLYAWLGTSRSITYESRVGGTARHSSKGLAGHFNLNGGEGDADG